MRRAASADMASASRGLPRAFRSACGARCSVFSTATSGCTGTSMRSSARNPRPRPHAIGSRLETSDALASRSPTPTLPFAAGPCLVGDQGREPPDGLGRGTRRLRGDEHLPRHRRSIKPRTVICDLDLHVAFQHALSVGAGNHRLRSWVIENKSHAGQRNIEYVLEYLEEVRRVLYSRYLGSDHHE